MSLLQLSPEQALQYAPDDNSVKAARKLAVLSQWHNLGCHTGEALTQLWGEIRGSSLYYNSIILSDSISFHCDCGSFKRPCKHSVALLVVYAQSASAFNPAEPVPEWAQKHRAKLADTVAKKAEKAAKPVKVADEAAQAKRAAAREQKVQAAVEELQQWLADLVRSGLATAKTLPYSHFARLKERLVDGQATGLVSMVDDLQSALAHTDWQQRAALQVGQIQLLLSAYQRLDQLPEALQADVRTLIGWTIPQEQVLVSPASTDHWLVVGHRELETEHNIRYRRQWLWGIQHNQPALILNFAAGFQPLSPALPVGTQFDGAVCWYPSAVRQRAIIKEQGLLQTQPLPQTLGFAAFNHAFDAQAQALAANPLLALFPMLLTQVIPHYDHGRWWLSDRQQQAVPLHMTGEPWPLLALSGGHPLTVFGEWDGYQLTGLSAWQAQEMISL